MSIIDVLSFILTIILLFTPIFFYSIVSFFVMLILYLLISIIFFKYTNKQFQKEKENLISFKLSKCLQKENNNFIIEFHYKNNKWINKKNESIKFLLDNYLFKKSFIIARIIRELRYPIVSNQIYLSKLFNFNLKINNINNLTIRFIKENKIKEFNIVENNISKNTILSREISKSKYFHLFMNNRSYYEYLKKITKINENIYLN